jgi:DNA-binding SARP family transcriptional activator/tetratricopeptide (TPR) repeat protein
MSLRFRVLGPVEVWSADQRLNAGVRQQRLVLAVLALEVNRLVPIDRLLALAWPAGPPPSARAALQSHVYRIRRTLGSAAVTDDAVRVETEGDGYLLRCPPGRIDLHLFRDLCTRARGATDERTIELLRSALDLWRGQPLAGVCDEQVRGPLCVSLEEERLAATEELFDAALRLRRDDTVLGELTEWVATHPHRQRAVGQLMLALHRGGRDEESIALYQATRSRLADDLGLDPAEHLQRLHLAILRGDRSLRPIAAMETPAPAASGGSPVSSVPNHPQPSPGRRPAADPAAQPDSPVLSIPPALIAPPNALLAPAQLPADVAAFSGRTGLLRQLDALLASGGAGVARTSGARAGSIEPAPTALRVATVSGAAGVGKTALVLHWAHRIRERFPDGQLFINLLGYAPVPPLRPIDALARFLRALGVPPEQVPGDVDEASALYRSLLAGRRALVLLDNARGSEQVRPLLPGSPGCLVVVTSRDSLGGLVARDGARPHTVGVLDPAEAHTLLTRLLGAERMLANPAAAAELARLCGHLPLALRIAAADILVSPHTSICDQVERLRAGDRLAALAVDEDGNGDDQATVRVAFDLSYAALPAAPRQVFRLLGVLPGPEVTVAAAAALAGGSVEEAGRQLRRLASGHLVEQVGPDRYGCHDLLRMYAAQRSAAEDDEQERAAALDRLLDHYLRHVAAAADQVYPQIVRLPHRADTLDDTGSGAPGRGAPPVPVRFSDHSAARAWLEAEQQNLVAAVRHAAAHGPHPAAWLLADALRGYFFLRMDAVDWRSVADAGLAASEAAADLPGQAAMQLNLAILEWGQSRLPAAVDRAGRALRLARRVGWSDGEASALGALGNVQFELGNLQAASDYFQQAFEIDVRTGRLINQATRLGNLASVSYELGRLRQAELHNLAALRTRLRTGSRSGVGIIQHNLGEVYVGLGRLDEALAVLHEALTTHREVGNRGIEADTLRCLAATHLLAGRREQAIELAEAALALARQTGDRRFQADALAALAACRRELGDGAGARAGYEEALQLAGEIHSRYAQTEVLIGLATLDAQLGNTGAALGFALRAHTAARRDGYRVLEGQALTALAAIHLGAGDPDQAVRRGEAAATVHAETGHQFGIAQTYLILGNAHARLSRVDLARSCWRDALSRFTAMGVSNVDELRHLLASA